MSSRTRPTTTDSALVTLVLGVAVDSLGNDRARNLEACLRALRYQTLPRTDYRVVLIEQGVLPRFDGVYREEIDEYRFAYSPKPFNRSWILNIGGLSTTRGIICTFDADLIVPPDFLKRGLLAYQCGAMALKPFTEVLYMDAPSTERVRARIALGEQIDCDADVHRGDMHPWSKGGCIWVDAALYQRLGGHDERFEGWGLEDREFWDRVEKHTSVITLRGRLLHMYHERSVETQPEVRESAVLYRALQWDLLPPQRGPLGDLPKFRHLSSQAHDSAASTVPGPGISPLMAETVPDRAPIELRDGHAEAILAAAESICRRATLCPSRHHDSARLHLHGLFAARDGQADVALACIQAAARLDSTNVAYLVDLCLALVRKGRCVEAIGAGLRALRFATRSPGPYRALAYALRQANQTTAAVLLAQEALLLDLTNASMISELAEAFLANGEVDKAALACDLATRMEPQDAWLHQRLGECHLQRGNASAALTSFQRARELVAAHDLDSGGRNVIRSSAQTVTSPSRGASQVGWRSAESRTGLHRGLAEALFRLNRTDEAVRSADTAVKYAPTNAEACRTLAIGLDRLGRPNDAVTAWGALGATLMTEGRTHEAADAFGEALGRKPDSLKNLLALGDLHATSGQLRAAVSCFERAHAVDPWHWRPRLGLGRATYSLGDIDRAWDAFAAFDGPDSRELRNFEQPRWDGVSREGCTILALADDTLGDAIQGLRYLPILRAAGVRIILQCPARLVPLARRLSAVDLVVAEHAPLPAFDIYVPLLQVPVIHSPCRWPVPPTLADFRADKRLVSIWKSRLALSAPIVGGDQASPTLVVGLSWAGHPEGINARARFTQLETFAPLSRVSGVQYVSLQMGPQAAEALAPPPGLVITHLQDGSCSLDDTAALMHSLHIIITVDTAVAHLAGALGRPVWMVLPHVADWRWMNDTERTPLYPTMRIFRQTSIGDWAGVFERVRAELVREVARARRAHTGLVAPSESLSESESVP